MKITKRVKASTDNAGKPITAATASVDEMLEAFENRLADFGIESACGVESACDVDSACAVNSAQAIYGDERTVTIYEGDDDELYRDEDGSFCDGGICSLAEIKSWWNRDKDSDPVLLDYDSFDEWFSDTVENGYLRRYYEEV